MFNDIQINSSQRIVEIREYLDFIAPLIPPPPIATPRYLNTAKGLIFVQLYGVIEHTITSSIAKCISYINSDSVKLSEIKPIIMGMALSPDLDSLTQASSKKWEKRHDVFQKLEKDIVVRILDDLMPTDGKNINYPQLQSIWKTFCLTDPIFHDNSFRGRMQDIVSNRINIAHGNLSASDIGARVTIQELNDRLNEVSAFCTHFISILEDYIVNKKYKK
jgi:MAE_28990/MAE_18760-like HEPN